VLDQVRGVEGPLACDGGALPGAWVAALQASGAHQPPDPLAVVFAALAVSGETPTRTGLSINKIVKEPPGRCAPLQSPSAARRSPPNRVSPPLPNEFWTTSFRAV
jgi:hypothetical protein